MNIQIVKPQDQGKGEFDGGKIIEQKPIGFSGEGSVINRLGPLFYWAWARAEGSAGIGEHPHQGFEILTYVLKGSANHRDSLGTNSIVGAGGAQLMQAGSGMWHAESIEGPGELLQIWLEPHLSQAVKRPPTYNKYVHEDFPISEENGVTVKTVLGSGSPASIVTDARMWDVAISAGAIFKLALAANRTLAVLAIIGGGTITVETATPFEFRDFVIVNSGLGGEVTFRPEGRELRFVLVEVPTEPDYPLYRKAP